MDKQSERKISVKVNGNEKKIETEAERSKEDQESFPWVLPDEETHANDKKNIIDFETFRKRPKAVMKKKQRKAPSIKMKKRSFQPPVLRRFIIPIIAILVGLGFGFSVLSFITNAPIEKQQAQVSQETVTASVKPSAPASGNQVAAVPNLQLFVVQGGAFSSQASAQKLADGFQKEGYPAVLFSDESPIFLFVGIAKDKGGAAAIGEQMKEAGLEVYVKAYQVDGAEAAGLNKEQVNAVQGSFTSLIDLSVRSIKGEEISNKEVAKIEETIKGWEKTGLPFYESIQQAFEEMKAYTNSRSLDEVYASQQKLIQALGEYEKWLAEQNNKKA